MGCGGSFLLILRINYRISWMWLVQKYQAYQILFPRKEKYNIPIRMKLDQIFFSKILLMFDLKQNIKDELH